MKERKLILEPQFEGIYVRGGTFDIHRDPGNRHQGHRPDLPLRQGR